MTATATPTREKPPSLRRFRGLWPQRLLYHRTPRWWQELALIGIGYYLYREARNLVPDQPGIAHRHGRSVQWLQDRLHLNFELSVNHFVNRNEWLAQVMDYYYATLHFVFTIAVLVWLFVAHKRSYRGMRTALFATTLIGLAGFFLYPLAPPRLDRKSTRLNSSHEWISYAVFCLKKKKAEFALQTLDLARSIGDE